MRHFVDFCRAIIYNENMNIIKEAGCARQTDKGGFAFSDKTVQGAAVGKRGDDLYVISARRFKLYTEGQERIDVLAGSGFIKWKRGEIPFCEGDAFEADAAGEYELNGACTFTVTRKPI